MQNPRHNPPRILRLRLAYRNRFDAVAMLIYIIAVHVWSLRVYPLGRDYQALAEVGERLPFLARGLFAWEVQTFGGWVTGYHLVNIALLYLSMLCIYWFANYTLKGLWWMGTLAATLFMANPVHGEAVLNLSGVGDLVPFLVALLAITFYASHAWEPERWKIAASFALCALATLSYPTYAYLFLVIILYEFLATEPELKSYSRLWPFIAIGIAGIVRHGIGTANGFASLYFPFYPIGFLPETAQRFYEHPILGWCAAATAIFLLILLHRKTRRPAILFAILAIAAIRLGPSDRPVDPVHLIGGGQLLFPAMLYSVGLVGVFFRIMENIRWRIPMVGFTTMLAIIFIGMQIHANVHWRNAGREVQAFQLQAAETKAASPGARIGICPDYQYDVGAPLCLSESIKYTTPFSTAHAIESVLPLNRNQAGQMTAHIDSWSPQSAMVTVSNASILDAAPWPYTLSRTTDSIRIEMTEQRENEFVLHLTPLDGKSLPEVVLQPEKEQPEDE